MAPPAEPRDALARGLSDSALLVLGSTLGAGLGLVTLRLLLTNLSEEDYGRYSLFLVVGGLLAVLTQWPTHAVLRLGAEEFAERGRVGRTFGSILSLIALSALVAGAGAWVWREELDALVEVSGGPSATGIAVAFGVLSALAQLSYALLQPVGKVGWRTLYPALVRAVYAALILGAVWGAGGLSLERVLLLCTAALVPAVALCLFSSRRFLGGIAPRRDVTDRALRYGWPLLLRNLGISGILYVDLLVIRHYLGPAAAGRYDVAYRIAEQVFVFGIALELLAAPILAAAAAREDATALRRLYRLVAPQAAWAWSLGAALLVVLAEPLVSVLGAKSVEASAAVLRMLAFAVALRGPQLLEGAVLEAHMLSRWPTLIFFVAFAVNLGVDVGLIQAGWGLTGAVVGTVLGFGIQGLLRALYIRQRFEVPALRPYAGVAPVLGVLGVHWLSGGSPGAVLGAWVLAVVLVLGLGRRFGLFPKETAEYLTQVRMPAPLRSALERLYL